MTVFSALLAVLLLIPAPARAAAASDGARRQARLDFLRGLLLEGQGRGAEALAAYEAALAQDPDSAFLSREAAELALETGDNEKALRHAQRSLELEPGAAPARVLLGRVQWASGEPEAAEQTLRAALKAQPGSAETIFALGGLLAERHPEKAKELLRRFVSREPDEAAEAHFQLGKLEMQAGRLAEARAEFRKAIELEPDLEAQPARYALAQSYELEHSTDAALAEYERIARLEPQNTSLLGHIGQLYFLKGDWVKVRELFAAAKAVSAGDPTANHWLALDAERRGEWAEAARLLSESAALPQDPGLNLRLSYYLSQAGRLPEAVARLEGAHARWPANDQVSYFLALGYDDLKKPEKAIPLLSEVVALKPDYRDARYQLAVLLEKGGRFAQAETELRTLLAQRPDDAAVLNYLGYALTERGEKLEEAERMIRGALRLDPSNGAYLDSLGWSLHKQKRSTEAVTELARAARALPEDETVWEHLGDASAAAGDDAGAYRFWKRSQALRAEGTGAGRKAAQAERGFDSSELGALELDALALAQGGLVKLSALSRFSGEVLGKGFSFPALVSYQRGDLLIELLGPLYTPLFRIRLTDEGFVMDPLRLEGLSPEAVIEAAHGAVSLIRDYLSGRPFEQRPAERRRRWRKRWIETKDWRVELDRHGARACAVAPRSGGLRLELDRFERSSGRDLPRSMAVVGRGFRLTLELDDAKPEFAK